MCRDIEEVRVVCGCCGNVMWILEDEMEECDQCGDLMVP